MNKQELCRHVEKQMASIMCFNADISPYIDTSINRTTVCLEKSSSKYSISNAIPFTVYNSAQYCIFLYFLSNTAYIIDNSGAVAEKIYYLNKVLNAVDIFYEVGMPNVFGVEHPLGSVMGRARYSDRFFFYQGCTVGGSNGFYPTIGTNVLMYSNSKILGKSLIGNNVILSANTYIKDSVIPDCCLVFGQSPNLTIKKKSEEEIVRRTKHIWRQIDG